MKWDAQSMTLLNIGSNIFSGCVIIPDGFFVLVKILQCYHHNGFLGRTELQGETAHGQLV